MEAYVLDRNFTSLGIVDRFESFIWTERYYEYGDFELYMPVDLADLSLLKIGNYLYRKESDRLMIIEKIKITFDAETGTHVTITGRSAESILTRRIVWDQIRLRTGLQTAMNTLVKDSIVNPALDVRKIPNFRTIGSLSSSSINKIKIDKTYSGDNVYEAIVEQCKLYGVGMKVTFDDMDTRAFLSFKLYQGTDHSYSQTQYPFVIFSPNFDNLINSEYYDSTEKEKNVALVAGEDTGLGTGRKTVVIGDAAGLDRKELYVDARDLQSELENDEVMSDEEYEALLINRGNEKLSENKAETAFSGEAETQRSFRYGEDFDMGDIVQVEDGYGHQNRARVIEFITSQDESGISTYPTFEVVQDELPDIGVDMPTEMS